jgi:hypothetical protein
MLTHLDLGSVSSKVLLGLLQKSPVLNTLVFKVGNYFVIILQHLIYISSYSNFVWLFNHQGISKFNQELMNSAVVPDCLTFTLKVVKFGIVHGYEHELFLAKYSWKMVLCFRGWVSTLLIHGKVIPMTWLSIHPYSWHFPFLTTDPIHLYTFTILLFCSK